MNTILTASTIVVVYVLLGYVIGVPAAALLDLWTDSSDSGRMPIRSILLTWPLVILAFIVIGPWAFRDYLAGHRKQ